VQREAEAGSPGADRLHLLADDEVEPEVVDAATTVLRDVAASTGLTMLLVEQNVSFGLRLVDTAHLLQSGRVVYEGPVAELDRDRLAGYLGIGAMLRGGVSGALDGRRPAPRRRRGTPLRAR